MWLILCEPGDRSALWAYQGLKARGLDPLQIVTPQALVSALSWEHRLGTEGMNSRLALHGGKTLDSAALRGILNRIGYLSPALFSHATAEDHTYAWQEMNSLFMSWLTAVPGPVLNRPSPQGLCGNWRHPSEWAVLAAQAGLTALRYRQSSTTEISHCSRWYAAGTPVRNVLVVGGCAIGAALPEEVGQGCTRLAKIAGMGVAGFEFTSGPEGDWLLAGASPQPELSLGGEPLLDALSIALRERAS